MSQEVSDVELIRLAQNGSETAFRELVKRYLRRGMVVAREYLPTIEDAEDVMQEVFRRVYSNLHSFDARRPFAPWFFTIVRNECRTAMKSAWNRRSVQLNEQTVSSMPSPEIAAQRSALKQDIEDALEKLAPMQKSCFQLCLVEGFSSAEAAAALGIAEATVRVHLLRARRSLQHLLKAWESEVNK